MAAKTFLGKEDDNHPFDTHFISVDNVVRLIWPRSDNLTFWAQSAKSGQIFAKKGQKSHIFESRSDFHDATSAIFCLWEM